MLEQVRTIDRSRLREYIGSLTDAQMAQVNSALAVSFGLEPSEAPVQEAAAMPVLTTTM